MQNTFFITGTDTDCGKTFAILKLMHWLQKQNHKCIGLKPIAAGETNGMNDDAALLQKASTIPFDYSVINPCLLKTAASPHIGSNIDHIQIHFEDIIQKMSPALHYPNAIKLLEGAGGWLCPISDNSTYDQHIAKTKWPVILIVGLRLGCLNHAQLTFNAIQLSGANCVGWICNQIDPTMPFQNENKKYLKTNLNKPCLGEISYDGDFSPINPLPGWERVNNPETYSPLI